MPILDVEISEVSTHILNPIIMQSIYKIIFDLGLKEIFKNNIEVKTGRTSVSNFKDQFRNQRIRQNRFECIATPQLNPTSVHWSECTTFKHSPSYGRLNHHIGDGVPILLDPTPQIYLYEQSSPCSIQLACNMVLLNDDIAYSIPSKFFNRYHDGSVLQLEDIIFDYPIPEKLLFVLYTLYTNRNIKIPFLEYLNVCSENEISFLMNNSDITNNKKKIRKELIIQKTKTKILCKVEHTEDRPIEEQLEKVANEFHIPFNCTIQFSRPNTLTMTYPIIIDNNVLPDKVIPIRNNRVLNNILERHDKISTQNYYDAFVNRMVDFIQNPYYDDWKQPINSITKRKSYNEIFVGAFTLDMEEDETVINLNQLGEYSLHPYVKQILREQCHGSFHTDCLFNITIYRNDEPIQPCQIKIDGDLKLYLPYRFPQYVYHLVISELRDLRYLNEKYKWIVDDYEDFFDKKVIETGENKGEDGYGSIVPFRILIADLIPYK